jgi:hypothetical protein
MARTPELKLLLIELSQNWLKMATDLEHMPGAVCRTVRGGQETGISKPSQGRGI